MKNENCTILEKEISSWEEAERIKKSHELLTNKT